VPTYQYTCTDCGEQVEVVQKFTDDPLTVCTACGGRLRKVFSPVGIVFKGSGFYRTDSRKAAASDGPAKKDKEPAGSKSSDSSSGSAKDSGSSGSSDKSSSSSDSSSSSSGSGSSGSGSSSSGSESSSGSSGKKGSKSSAPAASA
jgi:putative FmdB family regulatory protein